jgi:uncharacterized protein YgbK (DUF1537 family)
MSKLLLTFYGDDFTGSTDALEQLTLAGMRSALFVAPPTRQQLSRFKNLQAVGVAGKTRSLTPEAMKRELVPAFQALKKLGARHVHYKVCSTFDSSPEIGSIGCVMDLGAKIFPAPFIPLLVAAPALGRYTIFGNHFARFGIGSAGEIYRLDRHPSISQHPVTPMTEADLRVHLARQTKKTIALFDVLKISLPEKEMRAVFKKLLAEKPDVVLFDAVDDGHLKKIGALIDGYAGGKQPLFSIGSSGVEMALTSHWGNRGPKIKQSLIKPAPTNVLIGSGSCSPVTSGQIARALKNGFAEVSLDAWKLITKDAIVEIQRATNLTVKFLRSGRSVIVHTTKTGSDKSLAAKLKGQTASVLGTVLGTVLRGALLQTKVQRLCIAGGDTSSFAARAMGIEALEMIAPLTPGAPLCRAYAPGSPADGLEVVFKGGQVGAENYFEIVKRGKA